MAGPSGIDRTLQADGTRNVGGQYHGWDHLGRVARHAWVDGNLTAGSGAGAGYPTRTPVFSESYHYDRASNRIARWDSRPGGGSPGGWADRDFKFEYDGLDRLKEAKRGVYNPGAQTITVGNGSQQCDLDMLGNWTVFRNDLDGSSTYAGSEVQTRDHNFANEIDEMDRDAPGGTGVTLPFAYDDAGNMTERERSASLKSVYVHDAWNRLVKVQNQPLPSGGATTLSEYEYNGLHWRTVKRHDTSTPADGLDQQTRLYYDASWRLVEERVDENYVSSSGINRHMQNLWGARYIDDLVARRRDANMDGDCLDAGDATVYAVSDVQFSVVAMLNSSGALHERVAYDSYGGGARHHWMDDVDGDGDVDSTDKYTATGLTTRIANATPGSTVCLRISVHNNGNECCSEVKCFTLPMCTGVWSGCPGDFNRDESVNTQDFFDFLAALLTGCP
ncbi:MAG: hypothetical protein AB7G11_05475 [Phycisphaerales bacterium]